MSSGVSRCPQRLEIDDVNGDVPSLTVVPDRADGARDQRRTGPAEVRAYYEMVGDLYRAAWDESLHFAVFAGDEPRADAAAATERMLADEAGFAPGMAVLDVGCGSGGPALTIAAHSGAHVTGVDLVPGHIERARQKAQERGLSGLTAFVEGDALALPFPDASFDHVYAIESGYHAVDKARFYSECARVLRPGGSFVGTDWLQGDAGTAAERERYLEPLLRHHATDGLIRLDELRAHLGRCGLQPRVVEDLATRGDVMRNWEPLSPEIWPRLAAAARRGSPAALGVWRAGARALAEAAGAGAFILGHWVATK